MMLDYACIQGESATICDERSIVTQPIDHKHRALLRSPNYPHEYDNGLNCSCQINGGRSDLTLLDFYLEERDELDACSRDSLQIDNRSLCDHVDSTWTLPLFTTSHLAFHSNDVITRKGFWLMVSSDQTIELICGNQPTAMTMPTPPVLPVRHRTLSSILIGTILCVILLLLANLCLILICWKQRRSKDSVHSKGSHSHRPLFCSKRSSDLSDSSISYHETSASNLVDAQRRTYPTRHAAHSETTMMCNTLTGVYEDPSELLTLQRQRVYPYIQHALETTPYCPLMVTHVPACPCHSSNNLARYVYDSQHFYETIKDRSGTLRRPIATVEHKPETLV
jgi:hypothetical protein